MKKVLAALLAAGLVCATASATNPEITGPAQYYDVNKKQNVDTALVYGGDPAVLLDDDGTVYLYIGEDIGDGGYYNMPNYLCYSSKDLMNWKYEGIPLKAADFSWGSNKDAWAAQVVKHGGRYYFYNSKNSDGISVAVSDSPTGPFTDARSGKRLIEPNWTHGKVGWDDIDPTVWVENDENGTERRYLCWGNSNIYMAELTDDMINLTDKNGDGIINGGDITELEIDGIPADSQYTEAPWIYKRGGLYYIFFASNWHEDLSYATSESIWGPYRYAGLVMDVGASSNTNHPAVLDFNGETYLIYHTGAQENGGGYLRSVCIDRLVFDENGGVAQLEESSVGLDGTAVKLIAGGEAVFHNHFDNSHEPADYPMGGYLSLGGDGLYETDSLWELVSGKVAGENHVSIQSVNKMGYYVTNQRGVAKLLHDNSGTAESRAERTFIQAETNGGVTFESLYERGKYLAVNSRGRIVMADEPTVFEVRPFVLRSTVTAAATDGKITVTAECEPNVTAVIVIRGDKTVIGYGASDSEGNLSYSFVPEAAGEYEISCLGRTVRVSFGGEQ